MISGGVVVGEVYGIDDFGVFGFFVSERGVVGVVYGFVCGILDGWVVCEEVGSVECWV